jgi:hypothetical protein
MIEVLDKYTDPEIIKLLEEIKECACDDETCEKGTATPTAGHSATPTRVQPTDTPIPTSTRKHPTTHPSRTPTETRVHPTLTPTFITATPTWVHPTETDIPTSTATHEPTPTECHPTQTPHGKCYQWLCHETGNAGYVNYCCDSQGCVDGHMNHHRDFLGTCEENGITPHEDN